MIGQKPTWVKLATASSVASALLLLSGCSDVTTKIVKDDLAKKAVTTKAYADEAYTKQQRHPLFLKEAAFWVDKTPLPPSFDPSALLPPLFKKDVTMNFQTSASLQEIFARVSKVSGVLFTVAQDVYESDPSKMGTLVGGSQAAAAPAAGGAPMPPSADSTRQATPSSSSGSRRVDVMLPDLIYTGSLAGLLDLVATKANLTWKWDGEKVYFYRYETRIFKIEALAGKSTTKATVATTATGSSAGGGAGSSTGTSSQSMDMSMSMDIWEDIGTAVLSQLSPRGKMNIMPSTGTITVTDSPDKLKRIDSYLRELNKSLSKQVMINVQVYAVEVDDEDGKGIDWTLAWATLGSRFNFAYANAANTAGLAGIITTNLVNSADGKSKTNWDGSSLVAGALSSIGRTSLVTSTSVSTLNNITVPIMVSREQAYVAKQSTTVTGTTGTSQTAIEPGLLTTGFSMNLTPRLSDTDKLMLQYAMDLSDLIKITTFTSPDGKTSIQLPERNIRNFLQRVQMRSGQTLVLSGFQQTRSDFSTKGMGDANNWALGGGQSGKYKNTTLVIIITPYVTQN